MGNSETKVIILQGKPAGTTKGEMEKDSEIHKASVNRWLKICEHRKVGIGRENICIYEAVNTKKIQLLNEFFNAKAQTFFIFLGHGSIDDKFGYPMFEVQDGYLSIQECNHNIINRRRKFAFTAVLDCCNGRGGPQLCPKETSIFSFNNVVMMESLKKSIAYESGEHLLTMYIAQALADLPIHLRGNEINNLKTAISNGIKLYNDHSAFTDPMFGEFKICWLQENDFDEL